MQDNKMHLQLDEIQPNPSENINTGLDKKQSSLRSLKDLQNKKKLKSIALGIDQAKQLHSHGDLGPKEENNTNGRANNYRSLLNASFNSNRLPFNNSFQALNNSVDQILPPVIDGQDSKKKSFIIKQAIKDGQTLLRKRSPSDYMKRKSTPVTPKKNLGNITVPQSLDQNSFQLLQMTQNQRNHLNLSTVNAPSDIKIFPSLSQTPKFDIVGGLKVFSQGDGLAVSHMAQSLQPKIALHQQYRQSRIKQNGSRSGSRAYLISESKSQSRIKQRQGMPGGQAWEQSKVNQFLVRDTKPQDALLQLQEIASQNIQLFYQKPTDLDSTEPLDSMIDSLYMIIDGNVTQYNEQVKAKSQHLATGVRTEQCEDFMNYVCSLQQRNQMFVDSVEFFTEHINKMTDLENIKASQEDQIKQLRIEKEEIFLQRVDIERKYGDSVKIIDNQKRKNHDLKKQISQLNQQFERKKEECESLIFRLKNIQDLENMLEPPILNQPVGAQANDQSDPAAVDASQLASLNQAYHVSDDRVKGLETINKRLESEIQIVREALQKEQELKFSDNLDRIVKIQELFNKVQIENKQLRINNTKIESKLESKEKLISHLEKKVTSIMIEKEEIIIKLKSEIVILKNQIEVNDQKFEKRVQEEKDKFSKKLQLKFQGQIQSLETNKEDLTRERDQILQRIDQIQSDYDKLGVDFQNYRNLSSQREHESNLLLEGLQQKLKEANKLHQDTTQQLQSRIETLENIISVQTKQLNIQELKLQLIKEQTENLLKLKVFLLDDIDKSLKTLRNESIKVEEQMVEKNPTSNDYLISVKKAVQQSKQMLEMGQSSLNSAKTITNFLQVEEMMKMIIDQEKLFREYEKTNKSVIQPFQSGDDSQDIEKINMHFQDQEINKNDFRSSKSDDTKKEATTIQAQEEYQEKRQSKQKHIQPSAGLELGKFIRKEENEEAANDRDENYFITYCYLELISILTKIIGEIFQNCGNEANEKLPSKFDKLLSLAQQKSDVTTEQEIMQKFLVDVKNGIEDKFSHLLSNNDYLQQQLEHLNQTVALLQTEQRKLLQPEDSNNIQVASQAHQQDDDDLSGQSLTPRSKLRGANNKSSHDSLRKRSNLSIPQSNINNQEHLQIQGELQNDKSKKKELKNRSVQSGSSQQQPQFKLNNINKDLTNDIQVDNMDFLGDQYGVRKSSRRQKQDALTLAQNEIESLKLTIAEQKQRSKDLQLQLAGKIVALQEQLDQLTTEKNQAIMELEDQHKQEVEKSKIGVQQRENHLQGRIDQLKSRLKDEETKKKDLEYEITLLKEQMLKNQLEVRDFDQMIMRKEKEYLNYKENIQTYINIKTSQRNIFLLAFEVNNPNMSMIKEKLLKYYLNKCIKIDQDKFRFIKREDIQLQLEQNEFQSLLNWRLHQYETVEVIKFWIEIVDDQDDIDRYFKQLKNQIREGTCILYDLEPLYLSINLGNIGLNSKDKIKDYHLITKQGIKISGEDFMVSILRHIIDPLTIKIFAMNFESGEEYILELDKNDIFELTDGQNYILEQREPTQLVQLILHNLILIVKDYDVRVLACEHKIFFNTLFSEKNPQISKISEKKADFLNNYTGEYSFQNLALRDSQIKQKIQNQSVIIKADYRENMRQNKNVQTDMFEESLNENMKQVYSSTVKVGKLLDFKIEIQANDKKGATLIIFEEFKTKSKAQVCFYNLKVEKQFIIYAETLKISENQQILISCEKFQIDGFYIKIHDLKELASETFTLVKKANNKYHKLNKSTMHDINDKHEFRHHIYDLTFTTSISGNHAILASMDYLQEQQFMRGMDHNMQGSTLSQESSIDTLQALMQPPSRKRIGPVKEMKDQSLQKNIIKFSKAQHRMLESQQNVNSILLQKHERGALLYRNVYVVRCIFDKQEEQEQQSIISFFQKRDLMQVEVYLYKDQQKMSIASQVNSEDLFGIDHSHLSFQQQIQMLDQMMERLYVLSDNQSYHLKVENEAVPISQIIEQRRLAFSVDSNSLSMGSIDKVQTDLRIKEIQENRFEILSENRCQIFASYAQIGNRHYDYKVYFLFKHDKDPNNQHSPRKKQSIIKRVIERQTTNIEALIEDTLDYDQIYIEATDQQTGVYSTHLSQRYLSHLLSQNPYEYKNNINLISNRNKEKLVEFLKRNSKIDHQTHSLLVENFKYTQDQIKNIYQNQVGGTLLRREDKFNKREQEESQIIKKVIVNQEIDMSEFTYDMKIFLVHQAKDDKQLLSYSLEIFALNDPDIIYIYNYPAKIQNADIQVPSLIGFDIINLIENPMKSVEYNIVHNGDEQEIEKNKDINFYELFAKYIDNRLILVVSEQLFPWKLNYCLIEPCSGLNWNYCLDIPTLQSIQGPEIHIPIQAGALDILEQTSFESFIALVLNETSQDRKHLTVEQFENQEGRWFDIGDSETKHEIVKGKRLGDNLIVKITKVGSDNLEVTLKTKGNNLKEKSQSMSSSSIEDQDNYMQYEHKIMLNTQYMNKFTAQIIKRDKNNQTLVLLCEILGENILVKIVSLDERKIIYQMRYRDISSVERQKLDMLEKTIEQSLKTIINQSTLDKILKLYEENFKPPKEIETKISNLFFTGKKNSLMIDQDNRQVLTQILGTQPLILHRKTFFDQTQEKLIIVAIEIRAKINYRRVPLQNQIISECQNEVNHFTLLISEPETDKKIFEDDDNQPRREFKLPLRQCFMDEELVNLSLKNIETLKRLAKIVIEERTIINRVQSGGASNSDDPRGVADLQSQYKVEIKMANPLHSFHNESNLDGPQNPNDLFSEAKKVMDSIRKANNISANGMRKHQDRNINEIEEENENEDDDENQDDARNHRLRSPQSLQQNNILQSSTLRNQHQILEQSIIEEEASQEENDDSPPKYGDETYVPDSSRRASLHQKSVDQYSQAQRFENEGQTLAQDQERSIQSNEDSQMQDQTLDEKMNESDDNSAIYQVKKMISESEFIEVGMKPDENDEYEYYAYRKNLNGQITYEKIMKEKEIQRYLKLDNLDGLDQHQVLDDLCEVLLQNSAFQ